MGSGESFKQNDQHVQMPYTKKEHGAHKELKMTSAAKEHNWYEIEEGDPRRAKP